MKDFTNEELSLIVRDMMACMRGYHDVELDEYADQYAGRWCDIRMHGMFHEDDEQVQAELHDDYVELVLTIHNTLDDYRRRSTMEKYYG